MARNVYIRISWYGEGVLFLTTPSDRQLHCTCSAPNRPTSSRWSPDGAPTADSGSGTHSYRPSRQHRGTIGVSDRLMWSGHHDCDSWCLACYTCAAGKVSRGLPIPIQLHTHEHKSVCPYVARSELMAFSRTPFTVRIILSGLRSVLLSYSAVEITQGNAQLVVMRIGSSVDMLPQLHHCQ